MSISSIPWVELSSPPWLRRKTFIHEAILVLGPVIGAVNLFISISLTTFLLITPFSSLNNFSCINLRNLFFNYLNRVSNRGLAWKRWRQLFMKKVFIFLFCAVCHLWKLHCIHLIFYGFLVVKVYLQIQSSNKFSWRLWCKVT